MSAKDNAGEKLIASIQKTKAQAAGQDKTQKPAVKAAPKKAVSKKKVVKKTTSQAVSKKKTTTAPAKKELRKLFNSGRRVWPD